MMRELVSKRNKQKEHAVEGRDHLLTPREMEILQMVTAGYSNARIADQLGISPLTVKSHIYNACKKIKAPGRLQAALWAIKNL
jgi:DNA-binding CsgD family transcriptional regulator